MNNEFTNLKLSLKNLDTYYPRKIEFDNLCEHLKYLSGDLIDIGCGQMPYKKLILEEANVTSYTGLDLEYGNKYYGVIKPDLIWDGKSIPVLDNSFNSAISTQVLEHVADSEVFLKEVYRILKHDGIYYITVPFLWNLHDVPNDEYRYTPFSLTRILNNAGFREVEIKAVGGWHSAMGIMIGAYACRAPMNEYLRKIFKLISLPTVKYFMRKGSKENKRIREGLMITGLMAICRK